MMKSLSGIKVNSKTFLSPDDSTLNGLDFKERSQLLIQFQNNLTSAPLLDGINEKLINDRNHNKISPSNKLCPDDDLGFKTKCFSIKDNSDDCCPCTVKISNSSTPRSPSMSFISKNTKKKQGTVLRNGNSQSSETANILASLDSKSSSSSKNNKSSKKPTNTMDLSSLSYHGIRKLAPMPSVSPRCIPIERKGSPASRRISKGFGYDFSSGNPPLSPNLEDTASGYSPLLKKSMCLGFSPLATPTKFKKNKKNRPENSIIGVLAAQTLKIASINGLGELDKLENDLEEEINFENKSNAKTVIGRLRRQGHHHLHSKVILFMVVILNIIDCLLVMGELTLDFHHVSHLLQNKKAMIESFTNELDQKYSPHLDEVMKEEKHVLLQSVLDSSIIWPQHILKSAADNVSLAASQCHSYVTSAAEYSNQSYDDFVRGLPDSNWSAAQPLSTCFEPLVGIFRTGQSSSTEGVYKLTSRDEPNEKLIVVAHKLHYISVAILAVLVLLLLLKIICAGKRFLRSRMAVFDGIVVVISFIIDVVFIKGIHIFNTKDFVIILTFLLPWRIIRVLNSLIAAVLDKQRLNLKIIYTQKKKITRNLTEVNNKVEVMQRQIQILQGLCSSRGITDGDVRKILGTDHHKSDKHDKSDSKKHHGHGHGHGLAGMMALGKLAFQAADALAPMPDIKGRSTPTSPVSTPIFSTKHPLETQTSTTTTIDPSTHSNPSTTNTTTNNTVAPSSTSVRNGVVHATVANGSVPKDTDSENYKNYNQIHIDSNGDAGPQPKQKSAEINKDTAPPKDVPPHSSYHENPNHQNAEADEDYSVSETLDVPDISQSLSLDVESAATMSMDLKDNDDDDDDDDFDDDSVRGISASTDDVNVDFEMENETPSSSHPAAKREDNHINDTDAISRL